MLEVNKDGSDFQLYRIGWLHSHKEAVKVVD